MSLNFCYDLDIWTQGQGLRSFFTEMGFALFSREYEGDFDQSRQEAS